jgi:hypothetical protein
MLTRAAHELMGPGERSSLYNQMAEVWGRNHGGVDEKTAQEIVNAYNAGEYVRIGEILSELAQDAALHPEEYSEGAAKYYRDKAEYWNAVTPDDNPAAPMEGVPSDLTKDKVESCQIMRDNYAAVAAGEVDLDDIEALEAQLDLNQFVPPSFIPDIKGPSSLKEVNAVNMNDGSFEDAEANGVSANNLEIIDGVLNGSNVSKILNASGQTSIERTQAETAEVEDGVIDIKDSKFGELFANNNDSVTMSGSEVDLFSATNNGELNIENNPYI